MTSTCTVHSRASIPGAHLDLSWQVQTVVLEEVRTSWINGFALCRFIVGYWRHSELRQKRLQSWLSSPQELPVLDLGAEFLKTRQAWKAICQT
jgi:hypothetical protein